MNDDKFQKFAINLSQLLGDTEDIQDIYISCMEVWKKQRDFFKRLDTSKLLKLVIYIHSYRETGNFELAQKILNNLFFAGLFVPSGNQHEETCEDCNGNGDITCDYCNGNGTVDCDECDSSGEVTCSECDGDGVDGAGDTCNECDGKGLLDCGNCAGEGYVDCDECNTTGRETCVTCDGNGEVETDDENITTYQICSWDNNLKNWCELQEGTKEPIMSMEQFEKFDKYIIYLEQDDDDHAYFADNPPKEDMVYCSVFKDEPRLFLKSDMTIHISFEGRDINW